MSVTVTIPLSRLEDPNVNVALRLLLEAVSNRLSAAHGASDVVSGQAPYRASSPTTERATMIDVSPVTHRNGDLADDKTEAKAQKPEVTSPRPSGQLVDASRSASSAEDWSRFVAGLPERTQRFMALVQAKGLLTIDEAMALLGIDEPKALGGITGAIGRWAPQRGFAMPYETLSIGGRRAWRWLNLPGQTVTLETPEAAPASAETGSAISVAASADPKPLAKDEGVLQSRSTPPERATAPLATPRGLAEVPSALTRAVSVPSDSPYASAPAVVPKVATPVALPMPAAVVAAAPAVVVAAAPAAVVAPKAAVSLTPERGADTAAFTARIVALLTELPETSRRFLGLLDERGRLTMDEVLLAFGLDRPKAAGRIIEPIDRLFRSHGLDLPYDKDRGEDGRRIWLRKNLFS